MNPGSRITRFLQRPKWNGLPVRSWEGQYSEIYQHIPSFERQPFRLGAQAPSAAANRYRDLIVRQPVNDDASLVPVGVVSKSYALVQHRDIASEARNAVEALGIDGDSLECSLTLSAYGERMALFLKLPAPYEFNPGDGFQMTLRLCCYNSVDGTSGLLAHAGWYRFVCSNGMVVGVTSSRFQAIHNRQLDIGDVSQALRTGLESATLERQVFRRWLNVPVSEERLTAWIDGHVSRKWGAKAATRAFHIAQSGHDVEFAEPFEKAMPSKRSVKPLAMVPGAVAPARNAYAVCQALSWLAKERNDVQEQIERTRGIPSLMIDLLRVSAR
jgi:hypothetical protein